MIAVADTTPLRYLVEIECELILPELYGHISFAPAVAAELSRPHSPQRIRRWMAEEVPWRDVRSLNKVIQSQPRLGNGERQAISLALELGARVVLIDDWDAREEANRLGLTVAGTLRVLTDAAIDGLLDLPSAFQKLQQTSFRATSELFDLFLEDLKHRRRSS